MRCEKQGWYNNKKEPAEIRIGQQVHKCFLKLWYLFETPTPGAPNHTTAYIDYMYEQPQFSKPGGRFESPFQLSLSSSDPGDSVYFTTNGSECRREEAT